MPIDDIINITKGTTNGIRKKENIMTMQETIVRHQNHGGAFFKKKTMKFFNSRVESGLYKNMCFVTSESTFDEKQIRYTVRRFFDDFKHIETVSAFLEYDNVKDARAAARAVK